MKLCKLISVLLLIILSAACGNSGSNTAASKVYTASNPQFTFNYPAQWVLDSISNVLALPIEGSETFQSNIVINVEPNVIDLNAADFIKAKRVSDSLLDRTYSTKQLDTSNYSKAGLLHYTRILHTDTLHSFYYCIPSQNVLITLQANCLQPKLASLEPQFIDIFKSLKAP
jgi:uncharacterized lipoprotein